MAECITCGKAVADTTKTHRCKACGQREATIARGGKVVTECVCKQCGKSYMPKQAARSTCCSRECGFKWVNNPLNPKHAGMVKSRIDGLEKHRKATPRKVIEPKRPRPFTVSPCIVCGDMTHWYGSTRRLYCDKSECKRLATAAKMKVRYHGGTAEGHLSEMVARSCRVCGDPIEAEADYNAKDCMECRGVYGSQARDDRLKKAFVESVSRKKVFERDKWTCMLCGKRVSRTKATPHPMSAVVDHIVPLARGGMHEYKNVQCAHFACNGRKSANMIGQMRLFG